MSFIYLVLLIIRDAPLYISVFFSVMLRLKINLKLDRRTEIIFYGTNSHFLKQVQYCLSLCPVFSLFILLMDDLAETFTTGAKKSSLFAGNLVI